METLRDRIHAQVEKREQQFSELENKLPQLQTAIKGGDLKTAQIIEQEMIADLNRIFGLSSQRRQKVIQDLEQIRPKMRELTDWRHWGTTQAREKVMDEIKHIHDHEKDLEKVAQRIQEARNEWREWDKSGEGGDHKLYKEFDKICTDAYKPCAKHFENQKRLRKEATEARSRCCLKLEEAYEATEWREPDWKAIQTLIRKEQQFWRKHRQADFKQRKTLQSRFDSIIGKFNDHLDRERNRNLKNREQLIEKIEQLQQDTDVRSAMNQLNALKSQWNVTVNSGRKKEQAVWARFTKACDAIYDQRRQERKTELKEQQENLRSKESICEEIARFASGQLEITVAFESQLGQWQQRWDDTGFVPKKDISRIEKRFRKVLTDAKSFQKAAAESSRKEADAVLAKMGRVCEQIETAAFSGDTLGDQLEGLKLEFESLKAGIGSAGKMQNRFDLAVEALADSAKLKRMQQAAETNLKRLQSLLLQLEIATETNTPPEYAKDRMAMQISRLSMAMGKSDANELIPESELVTQFWLTGAVLPDAREACNARFHRCQLKH